MRLFSILLATAFSIGCTKKADTPATANPIPKKASSPLMVDFVDIILNKKTLELDSIYLDSLSKGFPILKNGIKVDRKKEYHFGVWEGELKRLDLVLIYAPSSQPGIDSLLMAQAMDCKEGKKSIGTARAKIVEKLGVSKDSRWEVGRFAIAFEIDKPDSSCIGLSIDANPPSGVDYD
jgi:hypothetical protein